MDHIRQISSVSTYVPSSPVLLTIYELIMKGADREELLQHFGGKGTNYLNSNLNRLKTKMLEGVLLYPFNGYAEYNQKQFEVFNAYDFCLRLIRSGNKIAGIPETEKTIPKALELGLTDIAFSLSLELEMYFSATGHFRKYKKYAALCDELKAECDREHRVKRLFNRLAYCAKKNQPVEDFPEKIKALEKGLPGKYFASNLYYFITKNLWYRIHDNKAGIIATCQQANDFFNHYQLPLPFTAKWNFRWQMIPIMVSQEKYAEAEALAKQCVRLCKEGNYNWHSSLLYLALVGFHSRKPQIALVAYKKAHSVPMKFKTVKDISERWQLIRSYLELFNVKVPGKFRLYKFLNSIPTLNADKSRNNVAVIIAHLLHLWRDGKRESFGDIVRQLDGYIHRHLNKRPQHRHLSHNPFRRHRWFLQMMGKFYDSNYHPVRYQPRIKQLWKKIETTESEISPNVFETEVIPLEVAWGMVSGELRIEN